MEEQLATPNEPISMEHWEDELEETLAGSELRRGELREGTILDLKDDGLVVDIGAKRDGFVPKDDLEDLEDQTFEPGQEVNVIVTRFRDSSGNVELSISQALLQEDWIEAERLKSEDEVYETTVLGSNRGGLTIGFGHLRGFVPMSQLIGFSRIRQAAERHRRLRSMVGQPIMLKVIEVNRHRRRLILSQQAAAKEWRAARRQKLLEDLEPGQIRRGRISQITDFGLFVNLGGLDGLVHISELSWGRIENPREIYHERQRVKVKVLSVDRERQRIALSIKALKPDPWETASERYYEGQLVEGKVSQVVDFGVFVELEPGIEGLLHNSELRDLGQREELESKQTILVKVIRVESDRRRMGLSVRQVRRQEWEEWVVAQANAEAEAAEQEKAEQASKAEAAEGPDEAEAIEAQTAQEDVAVEEVQADTDVAAVEETLPEEEAAADEDAEVAVAEEPTTDEDAEVAVAEEPAADADAEVAVAEEPTTDADAEVAVAEKPTTDADAEVAVAEEPTTDADAEVAVAEEPAADADAEVAVAEEPTTDEDAEVAVAKEAVVEQTVEQEQPAEASSETVSS